MDIEVVLLQDDPKLGKRGGVIKVSQGFAQNFLFPHNKAKLATPANLKSFEQEKIRREREEAQSQTLARAQAAKLKDFSLKIEVTAGEGDKLYGAVNSQDVAQALAARGIEVDRRDIHLEETIKKLGEYAVTIRLHKEIVSKIKIIVAKKP